MEGRSRSQKKSVPNQRLRQEREQRGWTREYVAEKIELPDPHTVGRWECGKNFPNPHYRQELCKLFEKNAEELGLLPDKKSKEAPDDFLQQPNIHLPDDHVMWQGQNRQRLLAKVHLFWITGVLEDSLGAGPRRRGHA
jgi:transcriptional regulator with XRE-family HTH domain